MTIELMPDTRTTENKTARAVTEARTMVVDSPESFTLADRMCAGLAALRKEVIDTFADAKQKAFATHRAITAAEAKHLEPIDEARKIYKQKLDTFRQFEEKKRLAEESRLRIEAQKQAEEMALKNAQEAHDLGLTEEADAILETPLVVAPAVVESTVPKSETVICRRYWAVVTNPALVPDQHWIIDEQKLNALARAEKKDGPLCPGVEIRSEPC